MKITINKLKAIRAKLEKMGELVFVGKNLERGQLLQKEAEKLENVLIKKIEKMLKELKKQKI